MDDAIEQTLHLCKSVSVYRIPPRLGAGGWRSGEWRVSDKIFEGRLRVVAIGERCEVRIEDPNTHEIFAVCPVPIGQKGVAVEPVTDSSRYFVLRVEDPATKRHAFLGLGFTDRGESFDFSVALADHDKHVQREKSAAVLNSGTSTSAAAKVKGMDEEMVSLYRETGDLSLKEGQTIRINVKRSTGRTSTSTSSSNAAVQLMPLPPPPAPTKTTTMQLTPPPAISTARTSSSGVSTAPLNQPDSALQTKLTSSWVSFD